MRIDKRAGAIMAALTIAGSAYAVDPLVIDGVVAYVNEHVITLGDVQAVVGPRQAALTHKYKGQELEDQLGKAYDDALNMLVERYLILDSYQKQEGKIPEWAVEQRVEEVVRENFNGDRATLIGVLAKDRLTMQDWKEEIRNHIIVSAMRGSQVGQNVRVVPAQVRAYYEHHAAKYNRPGQVKLRAIVLKVAEDGKNAAEKRRAADEIRQRLDKGEDFAALAGKQSEGMGSAEGGDWGWMAQEDLRSELKKVVSELPVGRISGVVATPDEIYIVKCEDRREKGVLPLVEVQDEIEHELQKSEAERLYQEWVERLKQTAYVKVIGLKP